MQQLPCLLSLLALHTASSFVPTLPFVQQRQQHDHQVDSPVSSTLLGAAGQGFGSSNKGEQGGKSSSRRPSKTYDSPIIRDVIDTEAAMSHFFSSREDWLPLFRWLASDPQCPAESFIGELLANLEFHEETSPWKKLEGIPQNDIDRAVLKTFLDETQQSLIDIPVNNSQEDDEDDIEFLEEGRRLLALQRFHVLRSTSIVDESLFATVWSELAHLSEQDEEHTGSLILAPDCDLAELRRFTDMNIMRPLEWLGLDSYFEVSSFSRGSPAIRLFYKLNDMPTDSYREPEEEEEA